LLLALDMLCAILVQLPCKAAASTMQPHGGRSPRATHCASDLFRLELLPVAEQQELAVAGRQAPKRCRQPPILGRDLRRLFDSRALEALSEAVASRGGSSLVSQNPARNPQQPRQSILGHSGVPAPGDEKDLRGDLVGYLRGRASQRVAAYGLGVTLVKPPNHLHRIALHTHNMAGNPAAITHRTRFCRQPDQPRTVLTSIRAIRRARTAWMR